jgi:hypothetical protein
MLIAKIPKIKCIFLNIILPFLTVLKNNKNDLIQLKHQYVCTPFGKLVGSCEKNADDVYVCVAYPGNNSGTAKVKLWQCGEINITYMQYNLE